MSTPVVYTFKDDIGSFHVYKHIDGRPRDAIGFIKAAFKEHPRCEASDLAVSFITANRMPNTRTQLTPHYDNHKYLEYRYEITKNEEDMFFDFEKRNFVISAFKRTSSFSDDPAYGLIFRGSLDKFEDFANDINGLSIEYLYDDISETYSPERKAEFILSNSTDEDDYQRACEEVRKLGIDPNSIKHHKS